MSDGKLRIWPGEPYPLGATWDGRGVNFALFSTHAERVELCLFDSPDGRETHRIALPEYTNEVWHAYLPDLRPGQLYGYRVYGPYAPQEGHRFNHHKLLIDPYAKSLRGRLTWSDAHYGYIIGHEDADLSFDTRDSAPGMPKCEVIDTAFTWSDGGRRLHIPWPDTVVYEMHARGFTMRHPDVPEALRGSFAGLATPSVLGYLKDLGITAVELLPIQAFVDDPTLVEKGLRNYWGYNSIAFFAPQPRYLGNGGINEFKTTVQVLHAEGIEVIIDVVYNHTAEGNQLGPTLSFRGIDNLAYYRLNPEAPRYYDDFTGCGNAFNLHHTRTLQLVMDSLRYWVDEIQVDGFRFDLATTLCRDGAGRVDPDADFLTVVQQDPLLSSVKLIAEPWDVGMDGYQVGNFPPGWAEWNDRYRDTIRRFWKGDTGLIGEMATRLTGSSDIFHHAGRRPWASVNFVTAHDGFTLHDLVSYDTKRNEANQEDNRDGSDSNNSWNCGVEGPTDDPAILELRRRQMRNILATLLLSQGVPMITAGDEFGRTQHGNNNAYCQDSELSWIDWPGLEDWNQDLLAFTRRVIALRHDHVAFRRSRFFRGAEIDGQDRQDIRWLRPDGTEKTQEDWDVPYAQCLCFQISGDCGANFLSPFGEGEPDDTFLVMLSTADEDSHYVLPPQEGGVWSLVLDTCLATGEPEPTLLSGGETFRLAARSLAVFVLTDAAPGDAPE